MWITFKSMNFMHDYQICQKKMGDFLATRAQIQSFCMLVFEDAVGKNCENTLGQLCYDLDTTQKKITRQFRYNWGTRFFLNCKIVQ